MASNPYALLTLLDLLGKSPSPSSTAVPVMGALQNFVPSIQFSPGQGLPMPPVLGINPPPGAKPKTPTQQQQQQQKKTSPATVPQRIPIPARQITLPPRMTPPDIHSTIDPGSDPVPVTPGVNDPGVPPGDVTSTVTYPGLSGPGDNGTDVGSTVSYPPDPITGLPITILPEPTDPSGNVTSNITGYQDPNSGAPWATDPSNSPGFYDNGGNWVANPGYDPNTVGNIDLPPGYTGYGGGYDSGSYGSYGGPAYDYFSGDSGGTTGGNDAGNSSAFMDEYY